MILDGLKQDTDNIIDNAKKVKKLGATGAYKKEFDAMSKKIDTIQQLLDNTTISDDELERIENTISELRIDLDEQLGKLQAAEKQLEEIGSSISLQSIALDDLNRKSEEVKQHTVSLRENATKLQEANVEGALNLTRQAHSRVLQLEEENKKIQELNDNAERQCKRTDTYIKKKSDDFARMFKENDEALDKFQDELDSLNAQIPDLNERICDKKGDPCDDICGGAGCDFCGTSINCEKGAMARSEKALSFAKKTEKEIQDKNDKADEIIRAVG
jgi:coxsackievirus/adenovirus receptor